MKAGFILLNSPLLLENWEKIGKSKNLRLPIKKVYTL